jgi:hypothetical protein
MPHSFGYDYAVTFWHLGSKGFWQTFLHRCWLCIVCGGTWVSSAISRRATTWRHNRSIEPEQILIWYYWLAL